jgi:recombinational DNA repair protein (RecF pathway)
MSAHISHAARVVGTLTSDTCARCNQKADITRMSFFNTDIICLPCACKERTHRAFATAVKAELEAVRAGNYNFPGIGKPEDL